MSALHALAARAGVDTRYIGWRGEPVEASRETLIAVLRALGHDVSGDDDAPRALDALDAAWWAAGAPPVVLSSLPLRVRADLDDDWEIEVRFEDGSTSAHRGRLFDLPADHHTRRHADPWCTRTVALPDAAHGYHRIAWRVGERAGRARWIAAPERAYQTDTARSWGVFAPLYALRSARSGAAGDLAELRRLAEHTRGLGGRWVGTLPLLAAFLDEPCEPSPYAPASRRFWNELYLDLVGAPGIDAPELAAERARLAAEPLVDYRAQYRWRRGVIDELARAAWAGPLAAELTAFAEADGGDLADYAAFRAIGEVERAGWSAWPAPLRDAPPRFTAAAVLAGTAPVDRARWQTHVYAQWAMDRQLAALGDALYLDLPVGVNRDAWEVWRDRDGFALGLSAGAPPDALFLGGQDWGLPPVHPDRARAAGWDYVIACVRHHMRHAGMLRVDHVMGLHRLYCVPAGLRATEGAYVRYAADELYAILTLESHRHRCALAGEDLGTVPDFVPPAMRRHGLAGLHVAQFGLPGEPHPAPTQVASMNTHDTPTFAGWWHGTDIDDKLGLGLIDDAQAERERADRAAARQVLIERYLPAHPEQAAAGVLLALTRALAAGDAAVVLATLEDAWLEPRPQNVPGTAHERPNWRRPFALDSDAALADPRLAALLDAAMR